jgi:muconate/chloromuconate cycloisomerase
METGRLQPAADRSVSLGRDARIRAVETLIVDLPLRRAHRHAVQTTASQPLLIVRLTTEAGVVGIGEGATPGGPWWGGDSVEAMKLLIDRYLVPVLIGRDVFAIEAALAAMDRAAARQTFAKAPLDMAMHDAAAKLLGVPVSHLLGGRLREAVPVAWALGAGATEPDAAEAQAAVAEGRHRQFKIKMGMGEPAEDVARVTATIAAVKGAAFRIDLNQAWDEPTAMRWAPVLQEAGVELFEQPLKRANLAGMRRLCDRLDAAVMADESVYDAVEALEVIRQGAADVIAVKLAKGGGLRGAARLGAVARAADMPLFGGTTLESSVGTAASLQLFAGLPSLPFGCELFGPLILADDLATEPVRYSDFHVEVPTGPGLGVELDPEKIRKYQRP